MSEKAQLVRHASDASCMTFSMADDSDASDTELWESDKEEAESPKVSQSCWIAWLRSPRWCTRVWFARWPAGLHNTPHCSRESCAVVLTLPAVLTTCWAIAAQAELGELKAGLAGVAGVSICAAWLLVFHACARRFSEVPFWHAQRCWKAYVVLRVGASLGCGAGVLLGLLGAASDTSRTWGPFTLHAVAVFLTVAATHGVLRVDGLKWTQADEQAAGEKTIVSRGLLAAGVGSALLHTTDWWHGGTLATDATAAGLGAAFFLTYYRDVSRATEEQHKSWGDL